MKSLTSSRGETSCIIGKTVEINGSISGEESLTIEGRVSGEILIKNHLTIGQDAAVQGNIEISDLELFGSLDGDILCEERSFISREAHIQGTLKTERLLMEAGARFNGTVEMSFELPDNI